MVLTISEFTRRERDERRERGCSDTEAARGKIKRRCEGEVEAEKCVCSVARKKKKREEKKKKKNEETEDDVEIGREIADGKGVMTQGKNLAEMSKSKIRGSSLYSS